MERNKRWARICAVLMVALLLVGCSSGASNSGNTVTDTKTEAKTETKTETNATVENKRDDLVFQMGSEPANLNVLENTTLISSAVQYNVHGRLVESKGGEMLPSLAKEWTWNDDYTQVVFTLRDGIKFSDGSAITPEDVVYSFMAIKEKGVKLAGTYKLMESIEATGENQVTIKLSSPYSPLISNMQDAGFSVMSKAARESDPNYDMTPKVVSGPYYVDEWKPGDTIVLKANEYYWEPVSIKTIKILFMPDENNCLTALEGGQIDLMTGASFALNGSTVDYLQGNKDITMMKYDSTNYNYVILNESMDYFKDINVRKAIDYAVNKEDVLAVGVDGRGTIASIPVVPSVSGYVQGYEPVKQDLAKAKEYMAASAYPDGFELQLDCPATAWIKAAQVIQANLKEIGITVKINETDVKTQSSNNASNNYQAFMWSFGNSTGDISGISSIYEPEGAKNYARITDPTIIEAFRKANGAVGAEREVYLKEAYDAIMEQTHYISLYFPTAYQAATAKLNFTEDAVTATGLPLFVRMSWK